MKQRAEAWDKIIKCLFELDPKWTHGQGTGIDLAIKSITKAFQSNVPIAEPLPFNLEAAKRGEIVVHGGKEVRWIGVSSIEDGLNIVESSSGVGYAADCDLFMKPKPMRTVYLNIDKDRNYWVYNKKHNAMDGSEGNILTAYPIQIPEVTTT